MEALGATQTALVKVMYVLCFVTMEPPRFCHNVTASKKMRLSCLGSFRDGLSLL